MGVFRAAVRVPGTCGELVQGALNGISFHITCPVNIYSRVEVELAPQTPSLEHPPGLIKAAAAVRRTLDYLGRPDFGGRLGVDSPLPKGKGMASSTADVAGAIAATALALGQRLGLEEIGRIALGIEPTDGCFYPGIVAFDHREGRLYQPLGEPPPIDIIVLDFGGQVDTLEFNRIDRRDIPTALEPAISEAFRLVDKGIATGSLPMVAQGATMSARANQQILYKTRLEEVIALARETGALGVNVAHSGTVIGVLLERSKGLEGAREYLAHHLTGLENVLCCSLVDGGIMRCFPEAQIPLRRSAL